MTSSHSTATVAPTAPEQSTISFISTADEDDPIIRPDSPVSLEDAENFFNEIDIKRRASASEPSTHLEADSSSPATEDSNPLSISLQVDQVLPTNARIGVNIPYIPTRLSVVASHSGTSAELSERVVHAKLSPSFVASAGIIDVPVPQIDLTIHRPPVDERIPLPQTVLKITTSDHSPLISRPSETFQPFIGRLSAEPIAASCRATPAQLSVTAPVGDVLSHASSDLHQRGAVRHMSGAVPRSKFAMDLTAHFGTDGPRIGVPLINMAARLNEFPLPPSEPCSGLAPVCASDWRVMAICQVVDSHLVERVPEALSILDKTMAQQGCAGVRSLEIGCWNVLHARWGKGRTILNWNEPGCLTFLLIKQWIKPSSQCSLSQDLPGQNSRPAAISTTETAPRGHKRKTETDPSPSTKRVRPIAQMPRAAGVVNTAMGWKMPTALPGLSNTNSPSPTGPVLTTPSPAKDVAGLSWSFIGKYLGSAAAPPTAPTHVITGKRKRGEETCPTETTPSVALKKPRFITDPTGAVSFNTQLPQPNVSHAAAQKPTKQWLTMAMPFVQAFLSDDPTPHLADFARIPPIVQEVALKYIADNLIPWRKARLIPFNVINNVTANTRIVYESLGGRLTEAAKLHINSIHSRVGLYGAEVSSRDSSVVAPPPVFGAGNVQPQLILPQQPVMQQQPALPQRNILPQQPVLQQQQQPQLVASSKAQPADTGYEHSMPVAALPALPANSAGFPQM